MKHVLLQESCFPLYGKGMNPKHETREEGETETKFQQPFESHTLRSNRLTQP